MNKNLEMH